MRELSTAEYWVGYVGSVIVRVMCVAIGFLSLLSFLLNIPRYSDYMSLLGALLFLGVVLMEFGWSIFSVKKVRVS